MNLIVDISPEDYEYLKSYRELYDTSEGRILKAVCNGKDAMAVIAEVTATVLTELQLEIAENIESIVGHYDKDTPMANRPSYKIERNDVRQECIDIIEQKINALKAEIEPQAEKEQTDGK